MLRRLPRRVFLFPKWDSRRSTCSGARPFSRASITARLRAASSNTAVRSGLSQSPSKKDSAKPTSPRTNSFHKGRQFSNVRSPRGPVALRKPL